MSDTLFLPSDGSELASQVKMANMRMKLKKESPEN